MSDTLKFLQNQVSNLAGAGSSIGDVTFDLSSFTQIDGTPITMTDLGTKGYGTLEPGSGTQEEAITFTGITQNADGTATLTGVSNQLTVAPYTETPGLQIDHAGGTSFIISNTAGFYDAMSGKGNDETITGLWTFPSIDATRARITADIDTTVATAFVTLGQLSRQAISGAADGSTTVKGIFQGATTAQMAAGTAAGGTGALLIPLNSNFNSTSSAAILVPVTDANGKISAGFGGSASTLATLNAGSKVVQNPASATTSPTASSIPLADGANKLDVGWLPTGTGANQLVQLDGASKLPAVDGSQLTNVILFKNGISSKNISDATVGQNIAHGLGKTPKYVRLTFFYTVATASAAHAILEVVYNGTTTSVSGVQNNGNVNWANETGFNLRDSNANGNANYQDGVVTVDGTNISIAWTRHSNPAGQVHNFTWEAWG